jgi:hypothetical protein
MDNLLTDLPNLDKLAKHYYSRISRGDKDALSQYLKVISTKNQILSRAKVEELQRENDFFTMLTEEIALRVSTNRDSNSDYIMGKLRLILTTFEKWHGETDYPLDSSLGERLNYLRNGLDAIASSPLMDSPKDAPN